uniref:Ring finger protein 31 n=1 Tax=Sphenodon punctatus TaxID=8508 RepID=A0A8D0LCD3_SPHPU
FEVCVCVAFGGALTRLSLPSLPGLPVERPPPEPPTSAWASKPTEALPLRPHWPCAACHRLNEARAVLCVACDRPRACKTPLNPSLDLGEQPPRGRWACHTCTFENEAATVLCAVCERPRLAGRPSLPDACPCPRPAWSEGTQGEPEEAPGWQCEHCTFWNKTPGRVCAICDRTSQPGGADPAPLRCEEQEKMSKKETPAGPRPLGKSLPPSQDEAEKRRQEKLREDGQRMVSRIRVRELQALGFGERGPVLQALYQNGGDVWQALSQLQRLLLEPFHRRLWEPEEPPIDFHSPDRQALLRRLLASLTLP